MNGRLEAFCDGVFAFALTLLIVDVRIPAVASITGSTEAWSALRHLGPSVFAFLLSFAVILITWLNHYNSLKLVNQSSVLFVYANGFLLLGVVSIPFTTSLLGAFVFTDHAAPAVAVYDAVLAAQAVGWLAITGVALKDRLCTGQAAVSAIRERRRWAYGAIGLYAVLAIIGLWLPRGVAMITTATWILWLALSLRTPRVPDVAA